MYHLITFQFYFSLLFSVLDFRECVLHSHLNVSVTIFISFRSRQAETEEMDLYITVLQTAMGFLSFLTQTEQVQGH